MKISQEKSKTMPMKMFWGVKEVYYGIMQVENLKRIKSSLSENVNHLVHTVGNDLISISALNTNDREAIESMLPHGVTKVSL